MEDNALIVLTLLQWSHNIARPLHLLFVDLTKAYDLVDRGLLWTILVQELQVEQDLM